MAAELALKAYLLRCGVPRTKMKDPKVGHNLSALVEMAVTAGLNLDEDSANAVLHMSKAHQDHFFRYTPDLSSGSFAVAHADPSVALKGVGKLLDQASPNPIKLRTFVSDSDSWEFAAVAMSPLSPARLKELFANVEAWHKQVAALSRGKENAG